MASEKMKNEVFDLFKRSVAPKLEYIERKTPTKVGSVVVDSPHGQTALKLGIRLTKRWNAQIEVFAWVQYYAELISTVNRAIAEEEMLIEHTLKKLEDLKVPVTPVVSPRPQELKEELETILEKKGSSLSLMLKLLQKQKLDLLTLPIPLFETKIDKQSDSLGREVEVILRKSPRSLPIVLVPHETTGDENTVVVVVHPEIMGPLTSRILQLFSNATKVILTSVIDPKLIDLYYLVQPDLKEEEKQTEPVDRPTTIEIEQMLRERLHAYLEQIAVTIRDKVKSTHIEVVTGSLGVSVQNLVEKYNASNLLVYSQATPDDMLDSEAELMSRLVEKTCIYIVWD